MACSKRFIALALGMALAAPGAGSAQTVLDYAHFYTGSSVQAYDPNLNGNSDSNTVLFSGLDFSDSRSASYTSNGFVGSAAAQNNTTFDPSSPGLLGPLAGLTPDMWAYAEVTQSSGVNIWEGSDAGNQSDIYFTLSKPTAWTFEADVAAWTTDGPPGESRAGTDIAIYDLSGGGTFNQPIDSQFVIEGAGYSYSISTGGVLPAGSYQLWISAGASFTAFGFENATGSAYAEITNARFTIPAPGAAALLGVAGLVTAGRRRN